MPSYSNVITEVTTEMPRARSIAIQSERVRRRSPLARTSPASWIAPPNSSSFSVSVVLPASGCEMIANVRRRATSRAISAASPPAGRVVAGAGAAMSLGLSSFNEYGLQIRQSCVAIPLFG